MGPMCHPPYSPSFPFFPHHAPGGAPTHGKHQPPPGEHSSLAQQQSATFPNGPGGLHGFMDSSATGTSSTATAGRGEAEPAGEVDRGEAASAGERRARGEQARVPRRVRAGGGCTAGGGFGSCAWEGVQGRREGMASCFRSLEIKRAKGSC